MLRPAVSTDWYLPNKRIRKETGINMAKVIPEIVAGNLIKKMIEHKYPLAGNLSNAAPTRKIDTHLSAIKTLPAKK